MASGVKVADRVKQLFNEMKVQKSDDLPELRPRIMVFGFINNDIDMENSYSEKDLAGKDVFTVFRGLLEKEKCRYILYDCHFETTESSKKEELVFTLWCPDDGTLKDKMRYASSKDALKKVLKGIKHDFQMNDLSDCGDRQCFADRLGKNIAKLEGVDLRCTGQ